MKLDKNVKWNLSGDLGKNAAGKQVAVVGGTGGIGRE
jgi:FlaA1/EpsC-like NDP-sugar epimerase